MKPDAIRSPSSRRGRPASPHQYLTKDERARPRRRRGNAEKLLFPPPHPRLCGRCLGADGG